MDEVKVKILNVEGLQLPEYKYEDDAGMDICSAEDVVIFPGNTTKIKTNISVELPPGYAFEVSPRSGIDTYTKLRVRLGTIDSRYRGFIGVTVDNISQASLATVIPKSALDEDCDYYEVSEGLYVEVRDAGDLDPEFHGAYQINKGDRIAQLKLKVVPKCIWEVVDELSETDRGTGGFGHTGVLDGDDGWDPNEDPSDEDDEYDENDEYHDPEDYEPDDSDDDNDNESEDEDEDNEESLITSQGRNLTKENGYLIDYDNLYKGNLREKPHSEKIGYLAFSEFFDGDFSGLLDKDKVAIWDVEESTVELMK